MYNVRFSFSRAFSIKILIILYLKAAFPHASISHPEKYSSKFQFNYQIRVDEMSHGEYPAMLVNYEVFSKRIRQIFVFVFLKCYLFSYLTSKMAKSCSGTKIFIKLHILLYGSPAGSLESEFCSQGGFLSDCALTSLHVKDAYNTRSFLFVLF